MKILMSNEDLAKFTDLTHEFTDLYKKLEDTSNEDDRKIILDKIVDVNNQIARSLKVQGIGN